MACLLQYKMMRYFIILLWVGVPDEIYEHWSYLKQWWLHRTCLRNWSIACLFYIFLSRKLTSVWQWTMACKTLLYSKILWCIFYILWCMCNILWCIFNILWCMCNILWCIFEICDLFNIWWCIFENLVMYIVYLVMYVQYLVWCMFSILWCIFYNLVMYIL